MIENLNGIHETVNYGEESQIVLYFNDKLSLFYYLFLLSLFYKSTINFFKFKNFFLKNVF